MWFVLFGETLAGLQPWKSIGARAPGALPPETGRARQVATSKISSHSSQHGAPSASSTEKSLTWQVLLSISAHLPPSMLSLEGEGTRKPPIPLYTSWQARPGDALRCTGLTVHLRKAYTRKATANPLLNEKLLISHQRHQWETVLAFYLAPLRDVQSPVKGQGDRMPGWEAGLQRWTNGACWELF